MYSDITKKDHEQNNLLPIIVVFYGPYTRDEDYKGLNRIVTSVIYLTIQTMGQPQINTAQAPCMHNIITHPSI